MLLSLVAEKSFEHVDWVFFRAILKNKDLGLIMLQEILALYHQTEAKN